MTQLILVTEGFRAYGPSIFRVWGAVDAKTGNPIYRPNGKGIESRKSAQVVYRFLRRYRYQVWRRDEGEFEIVERVT